MTGESTTRDLFWELSSAAGFKVDRSWCMNIPDKKTAMGKAGLIENPCTRVAEDAATGTRITYQFVSKANATREVEVTRNLLKDRPPDVVFAYCFGYDWYNTLMTPGTPGAKPAPDAMGEACMQHLNEAVRSQNAKVRTILLGPTFPPAWVSPHENRTQPDSSWLESSPRSTERRGYTVTTAATAATEISAYRSTHLAVSMPSSIATTS